MLNAFRHHRGRHRSKTCTLRRASGGAQRLSASQRSAPASQLSGSGSGRCAQRLSASQRSAPSDTTVSEALRVCSTPFGITEVGTLAASNDLRRMAKCSTPFGITEVGTLQAALDQAAPGGCSTPFGITEVGTTKKASHGHEFRVLNAFRHHRGRHAPCQETSCSSAERSAQRLSASQRSARASSVTWVSLLGCAQRLSASQRSALAGRGGNDGENRCSTPFGITEVGTPCTTHKERPAPPGAQRLSASQRSARWKSMWRLMPGKCSTPFGITEVGTTRASSASHARQCAQRLSASQRSALSSRSESITSIPCAQRLSASQRSARSESENEHCTNRVLNAFRHHRGRHLAGSSCSATFISCSTPFGITEVGTHGQSVARRAVQCAQRLSASQRSARRDEQGS